MIAIAACTITQFVQYTPCNTKKELYVPKSKFDRFLAETEAKRKKMTKQVNC